MKPERFQYRADLVRHLQDEHGVQEVAAKRTLRPDRRYDAELAGRHDLAAAHAAAHDQETTR